MTIDLDRYIDRECPQCKKHYDIANFLCDDCGKHLKFILNSNELSSNLNTYMNLLEVPDLKLNSEINRNFQGNVASFIKSKGLVILLDYIDRKILPDLQTQAQQLTSSYSNADWGKNLRKIISSKEAMIQNSLEKAKSILRPNPLYLLLSRYHETRVEWDALMENMKPKKNKNTEVKTIKENQAQIAKYERSLEDLQPQINKSFQNLKAGVTIKDNLDSHIENISRKSSDFVNQTINIGQQYFDPEMLRTYHEYLAVLDAIKQAGTFSTTPAGEPLEIATVHIYS
jgi:hypothetical protein